MVIRHNLPAMTVGRCLFMVSSQESKLLEKLSSGYRINRAADDAAGLAISETMRYQIRGLARARDNAQDGICLLTTAEGALQEVQDMLNRMATLAVQASNGIYDDDIDRANLQKEVAALKDEINRIAGSTSFNGVHLLDGSISRKGTKAAAGAIVSAPDIIFYDEIVHEVVTTQKPQHPPDPDLQKAEWNTLKTVLKEQIVPQAVTALLNTFSDTFGYLKDSSIGIGLSVYENDSSSTVASVMMRTAYTNGTPAIVDLAYSLQVNTSFLSLDDADNYNLTPASRVNLESTIVHEMMHALMDEALTGGMAGVDQNMKYTEGFPSWFIEGTAQAAGGGADDVSSWLRIDGNTSEKDIQAVLDGKNKLGSGTTASQYATGYLAAMYLGYLAGGGNSVGVSDVASGLDRILNDVRGGKSLSQSIADNTNNTYSGIHDFENRFARDGASFVRRLMGEAGMGKGALVTGNYQENNLLEDVDLNQPLFKLNTDYTEVWNEYPDGYTVISGGQANQAGVAGPDHPNATPGSSIPGGNTGGGTGGTVPGGGSVPGGGTAPGGGNSPGNGITPGGGLQLQIGSDRAETLTLHIAAMDSSGLGIAAMNVGTQQDAVNAIDILKDAINKVSVQRAELGAFQNRLEHTINSLNNTIENIQFSESRIRDTDMAEGMSYLVRQMIIRQAGQAMLAQANLLGQDVLDMVV